MALPIVMNSSMENYSTTLKKKIQPAAILELIVKPRGTKFSLGEFKLSKFKML